MQKYTKNANKLFVFIKLVFFLLKLHANQSIMDLKIKKRKTKENFKKTSLYVLRLLWTSYDVLCRLLENKNDFV